MKTSRTVALVGKELKRLTREPSVLFMAIVFPLILTLAFGASFGAIGGSETRYPVAVVNLDSWGLEFSTEASTDWVTGAQRSELHRRLGCEQRPPAR